jgi:agmatinase
MGFLNIPDSLTGYRRARYVVLPVPYDATTSYFGGTRLGPAAVLEASQHIELLDEELLIDASGAGVFTADPVRPVVSGPQDVARQAEEAAAKFAADGKFVLGLGGEHSFTVGLVKAAIGNTNMKLPKAKKSNAEDGKIGVLQIDAHSDLRDSYMGSPWSHGCVMRRLHADLGLPISPVGIRSFSQGEYDYMQSEGIEPITPAMLADDLAGSIGRALDKLPSRIYLTIDIDAFDPSLAPGTGTPEPGGLSWQQVTALVREACRAKTIVSADIVEVTPVPGACATEYLAARLAYKLICYRESARKKLVARASRP